MVLRGFLFSLITFGLTFVVAFVVAGIIKFIAVAVQRKKKETEAGPKQP